MKIYKIFASLFIIAFILCSNSEGFTEDGVTDTEIRIGQSGPQTGPASPWGIVNKGSAFYFDMINNEGGINGRKVVIFDFDDSYNPAATKAGVKKIQEQEGIFAWLGIVGSETALTVVDYFEKRKIPWVGPIDAASIWTNPPHKYIFTGYPSFVYESSAYCKFAVKHLGKKRIAIIYQDAIYGRTGLEGARKGMAELGMKLVSEVAVPKNESSFQKYVLELKKADADTVIIFLTPFEGILVLKTANSMKFAPQWMASSSFCDFDFLHKITKGIIGGMISSICVEPNETPKLKKYKEAYKKLTGKESWGGLYFKCGIGFAEIIAEGLIRCGTNLTRERFVEQMEKIKNFKGISGTISYKPFDPNDPSCREGQNEIYLIQCMEDGNTKILTDWIKPGQEITLRK